MRNERFDAAETLGERVQTDAVQQAARRLERAEVEREHPAEAAHLRGSERVLRMRRKTRIVDAPHFRVRFQELREREAVRVVLRHPQRQRLGAPQYQPRIEWAEDRALGVL